MHDPDIVACVMALCEGLSKDAIANMFADVAGRKNRKQFTSSSIGHVVARAAFLVFLPAACATLLAISGLEDYLMFHFLRACRIHTPAENG